MFVIIRMQDAAQDAENDLAVAKTIQDNAKDKLKYDQRRVLGRRNSFWYVFAWPLFQTKFPFNEESVDLAERLQIRKLDKILI